MNSFSLHSVKKVKQVETEVSKRMESARIVVQISANVMNVGSFGWEGVRLSEATSSLLVPRVTHKPFSEIEATANPVLGDYLALLQQ